MEILTSFSMIFRLYLTRYFCFSGGFCVIFGPFGPNCILALQSKVNQHLALVKSFSKDSFFSIFNLLFLPWCVTCAREKNRQCFVPLIPMDFLSPFPRFSWVTGTLISHMCTMKSSKWFFKSSFLSPNNAGELGTGHEGYS